MFPPPKCTALRPMIAAVVGEYVKDVGWVINWGLKDQLAPCVEKKGEYLWSGICERWDEIRWWWGSPLGWSKLPRKLFLLSVCCTNWALDQFILLAVSALSQQRCRTAGSKSPFSNPDQSICCVGIYLQNAWTILWPNRASIPGSSNHPDISHLLNICPSCLQRRSWSADVDEPQTHRSMPPLQSPSGLSPPTSSPGMSSPCSQICPHHYHAC